MIMIYIATALKHILVSSMTKKCHNGFQKVVKARSLLNFKKHATQTASAD